MKNRAAKFWILDRKILDFAWPACLKCAKVLTVPASGDQFPYDEKRVVRPKLDFQIRRHALPPKSVPPAELPAQDAASPAFHPASTANICRSLKSKVSVSFSIKINNANIWASTSTAKRGHARSCWLCLSTKQNIKHHAASQIDLQMAASPSLLSPIKINGSGIPNAPGKVLKKFHYLGQTLSEQEPAMY